MSLDAFSVCSYAQGAFMELVIGVFLGPHVSVPCCPFGGG